MTALAGPSLRKAVGASVVVGTGSSRCARTMSAFHGSIRALCRSTAVLSLTTMRFCDSKPIVRFCPTPFNLRSVVKHR